MSHNPRDWHTSERWELENSELFYHIRQFKETYRANFVSVCSILHKIKRDFDCVEGNAASLNEKSTVEKIQRGNFTPAYKQGSE